MEETQAAQPETQAEAPAAVEEQVSQADGQIEGQNEEQIQVEEPQPQEASQSEVSTPQQEVIQDNPVEEDTYTPTQVPEYQPFDLTQYATDDGTLDVQAANQGFNQAVQQGIQIATSQMQLEMQERAEWDKAVSAYPELRKDAQLRSMVHQLRAGSVLDGDGKNYLSPKQAADRIMKIRGVGVQEGVKQAQTHTRVQESAQLETSDTTSDPNVTRRSQLKQQMNSSNYKERQAANKELLKDVANQLLQQQLNQ